MMAGSRRPVTILAVTAALACASPATAPPGPQEPVDAAAGGEAGTGGGGGTPATAGSGGRDAGGGAGGGTGGAAQTPDAEPSPPDVASPAPDAAPTPTNGQILFELKDPLPPLVQSHRAGDISWFDDPTEGKVVRLRAVDSNDTKERGEFDMAKDILKNGDTVWVGWRAKLVIPNPAGEWRNIFQ